MSNLMVTGTTNFSGIEIPVVLGGFGEGKRCLSDKTIAEIHGMNSFNVRKRIADNISRFKECMDIIDLKQGLYETKTSELLLELGYTKSAITQAEHIYLLSERGYSKLIKIMDTDLAWEVHDKLMDEYFEMRENRTGGIDIEKALLNPDTIIQLATRLKEKTEESARLTEDVTRMRPKEIFADAVAESPSTISVGTLAKLLNQNGFDIGQNRLFIWMRENGYLSSREGVDWNMPTQRSMDMGLFETRISTATFASGESREYKTPLVTGKGQQYFINKFLDGGSGYAKTKAGS